jgi:hypothetical protein
MDLFQPTLPRQCVEIVLVDVVRNPAHNGLESPFFIQDVVFELGEKYIMVPIDRIPLVSPSQAGENSLDPPARGKVDRGTIRRKNFRIGHEGKKQILLDPSPIPVSRHLEAGRPVCDPARETECRSESDRNNLIPRYPPPSLRSLTCEVVDFVHSHKGRPIIVDSLDQRLNLTDVDVLQRP